MTNGQPSKLDRIENLLERVSNVLGVVTETALKNEQNIGQINTTLVEITANQQRQQIAIDALIEVQRSQQETTTLILNRIDIMQSEIRGLQTENRRILDRLLGEETDENS
ncbi:MAG: hypothetical protein ACRC2R_26405 [Xenococcaceae cyanobacterium]